MVPAPRATDAEPDPDGPLALWRRQIRTVLSVSEGGIIVGLNGAHWAAAKPLVAELRGDGAPVRVCVDPRELLSIPAGSRVVLLEYVHDLAWLNLHRPVVRERKLRLFLWCLDQHINEMRVHAADFLDWVSHRVTIPPFLSQFAKRRLEEAQASSRWVAVRAPHTYNGLRV